MTYLNYILALFLGFFESTAFESYLEQHHVSPDENGVYVVISGNNCGTCSKLTLSVLEQYSDCSGLTVITGSSLIKETLSETNISVVYDADYEFDYLPYNFTYTSLLRLRSEELDIETFGILDKDIFEERLSSYCQ